jgi:amino acid transporter
LNRQEPKDVGEPVPRRQLTLLDAASLTVGIIIGSGFFVAAPDVARSAGGAGAMLAAWAVGGTVSLLGALCYAELATAYPRDGGDYIFLTRAFGPRTGFLFAWAGFWIVRPGNVGAMAFVFARYAQELAPLKLRGSAAAGALAYACAAVTVLTAVNVLGLRTGKWTQNLLTAAKVLGLLAVCGAGLVLVAPAGSGPARTAGITSSSGFARAMILVLFAYGGWSDVACVAAEVRDPRRNILRALLLGTLAVAAIYLLGNLAFLRGLGYEGVAGSKAVAADLLRRLGGDWGARAAAAVSLLICVSCLGAINGMVLTGARIFYAVGADHPAYRWLGRWDESRGTPGRSLTAQALVTLAWVAGFGLYENGFERLVLFTAPLFWLFLMLAGASLYVLRGKEPDVPRAYRVTGYPLTPALFCLSSAYMLYASLTYAIREGRTGGVWAAAVMVAGVVALILQPPATHAGRG